MFRNTLSANDNYPFHDFGNLLSPIEMEFSLKTGIFSDFFLSFLESTSNFKHFGKKNDRHTYFISEITECEKRG